MFRNGMEGDEVGVALRGEYRRQNLRLLPPALAMASRVDASMRPRF